MPATDRSILDLVRDIFDDTEGIIRSEFSLAKAEIRENVQRWQTSLMLLAIGVVGSLFAVVFLLMALVYALSYVFLIWVSALLVSVCLALGSAAAVLVALRRINKPQASSGIANIEMRSVTHESDVSCN